MNDESRQIAKTLTPALSPRIHNLDNRPNYSHSHESIHTVSNTMVCKLTMKGS